MIRTAALGAIAAVLLVVAPAQARGTASCKVALDGYRSVHVLASGLTCARAASVTRTVAKELRGNGSISVPGVTDFSVSTQSCTGCGTTTAVTLVYTSGAKIVISLRSGSAKAPSPPTSGGSHLVTV